MKPAKQPAKKRGWAREQVRLARKALRQWPSWMKPAKASIIATCGHETDDSIAVRYNSEDCDAVDGFQPCVVYAEFCRKCASEAVLWPEFLAAEAHTQPAVGAP